MDITLVRDYGDAECTLGMLRAGDLSVETLELPWRPGTPPSVCGRQGMSCVPPGKYDLVLHNSAKHPQTFALSQPQLGVFSDVSNIPCDFGLARSDVLIHVANYVKELEGCIAVGYTRIKSSSGYWWIARSGDAMRAFQKIVPWALGHTLTISYKGGFTVTT